MDRILEYVVREEDLPETVNGIIGKLLKSRMHLTTGEVSHAKFHDGGIMLFKDEKQGTRVTVKDRAEAGNLIRVTLADEPSDEEKTVPCEGPLAILYEDQDMVVVDKPAGTVVHPSHGHYFDSEANFLAFYYKAQGLDVVCRAVGRLDKDTSGVLVFAKNRPAAGRLFRQKEQNICRKVYLAAVRGHFSEHEKEGVNEITLPIGPIPGVLMKQQVTEEPFGKPALTKYRVLAETVEAGVEMSLVEAEILTGRTHQIRVHMSAVGHPLIGDPLYGEIDPKYKRAMLHAEKLIFRQPFEGTEHCVAADMPSDFPLFQEISSKSLDDDTHG